MAYVSRPIAIRPRSSPTCAAPSPRSIPPADLRRPAAEHVRRGRAAIRRSRCCSRRLSRLTALVLTCVGVYGVLAYAVARRRHEFGVRRALGAGTPQVLREVFREGLGSRSLDAPSAWAARRSPRQLLQNQLYGVHPRDPVAYGAAIALILAGALSRAGFLAAARWRSVPWMPSGRSSVRL